MTPYSFRKLLARGIKNANRQPIEKTVWTFSIKVFKTEEADPLIPIKTISRFINKQENGF